MGPRHEEAEAACKGPFRVGWDFDQGGSEHRSSSSSSSPIPSPSQVESIFYSGAASTLLAHGGRNATQACRLLLVVPQLKFTMSGTPTDDATGQVRPEEDVSGEKVEETQDEKEVSGMPSRQEEEAAIKKKYGGILPRKTPLISKDHERAYFDSADWALGKQGGVPNKPKGPLEALRPKLQPTQQNARARRTSYASADNDESLSLPSEDFNQDGGESVEDKNKE